MNAPDLPDHIRRIAAKIDRELSLREFFDPDDFYALHRAADALERGAVGVETGAPFISEPDKDEG